VLLTESGRTLSAVLEHPSGVTHHGFFALSGDTRLYTALYLPTAPATVGVLVCPSWGLEANHLVVWSHRLAHDLAQKGLAAAVLQWPGTEDSEGEASEATLDSLVQAGVDTQRAVQQHCAPASWAVAGMRLGSAPAALLADAVDARSLLLVHPVLDLPAHFAALERNARRAQLGKTQLQGGWAHGHPSPAGLQRAEDVARVAKSLEARRDRTAIVQYRQRGGADAPPEGIRVIRVRGSWGQMRYVDHWRLRGSAVKWLTRAARSAR